MRKKHRFGTTEEFNEQVEFALREVAEYAKTRMPMGLGFTLLMFDFGEGGNMFYISNAQREDVLKSMEEFLEKNRAE